MWRAAWCAALLLGAATRLSADPRDTPHPDDEALNWVSSADGGGLAAWRDDPALYLVDELPRFQRNEAARPKRKRPSLSINNPMEVLRQRLVLEIARKHLREHAARQAEQNRVFLQNVGKRGLWVEGLLNPREDN